jgi:hypothetical protein
LAWLGGEFGSILGNLFFATGEERGGVAPLAGEAAFEGVEAG